MKSITLDNYKRIKPSEFINSWKSDYDYFNQNIKNERTFYDVGEISLIPFLSEIPCSFADFQEKIEAVGHVQTTDNIEMLFYKIAIGMPVAFELGSLYPKIHRSTLKKVDKYISNQNLLIEAFSGNFRKDLIFARITKISNILSKDGY